MFLPLSRPVTTSQRQRLEHTIDDSNLLRISGLHAARWQRQTR